MVIDVLMPSYTSRMKTNQRAGELILDAIPGLNLALSAPGELLEIAAQLLEAYRLAFPSPPQWPQSGSAGDAAEILRREFGQASGMGSAQHPVPGQTGLEFAQ